MKEKLVWLAATILIGLALRLTLLGTQSLWYDEGVTWWLANMTPPALVQWTAADIQPPLYYLLMGANRLALDNSEWALRFPSVLFNILTIPLVYVLARRLFYTASARPPAVPLSAPYLAAIIFAVSPLMVYYSQEARMYTLLALEATLAGYLLLRLLHHSRTLRPDSRPRLKRRAVIYGLVMVAALYTHYFALFLVAAHLVYALFVAWRQHWPGALMTALAYAGGAIAVLFAPWLPTLLSRLGDDPSYWPGPFKLDEALRKIVIAFSLGETVPERSGAWLALIYLGLAGLWLLMAAGSLLGKQRTRPDRPPTAAGGYPVLFLLLWLLLPVALSLGLSYQSPKFNPRYTLLAWPAFALMLAAGLARLAPAPSGAGRSRQTRSSPSQLMLFILFAAYILITSGFSLFNWFTDPRFAKDDFKALARFVQERIGPNETVLLSSGHMFPVWAYYYGWQDWTPLPDLPRLDVNRVVDLTISADMTTALRDKSGAWLVSWQDEVTDPNGVIPFWLDLIGRRPDDAGDFQGVRLEHWQFSPEELALLSQDPIQQPMSVNFADQVTLTGVRQLDDETLILFWQPRRPLPQDLILTLDLTDAEGFDWSRETAVGRPGAYLYPSSRWPVDRVTMTRQKLPWQAATPPGRYIAEIGLGQVSQTDTMLADPAAATNFTGWDILDDQGRPRRRTARGDSIHLSNLVPSGPAVPDLDPEPLLDFAPLILLRRMDLSQTRAEPGDRILLRLLWQAGPSNQEDVSLLFDLVDGAGQRVQVGRATTPSRSFNLSLWDPGDLVLGQYWLDIPPEAAQGPATLRLHIVRTGAAPEDRVFPLAELDILPTERRFEPPDQVDLSLQASFSDQVDLLGVDCRVAGPESGRGEGDNPCAPLYAASGEMIDLTLYWRAGANLDTDYTVFTHLLDEAEVVVVNADHAPPRPSRGWVPGEIIADPVTLNVPIDLPPGRYRLEVGLYDAADPAYTRLPLTRTETRLLLPGAVIIEGPSK